jgi:thiol:disulfide interchange protein DsbC
MPGYSEDGRVQSREIKESRRLTVKKTVLFAVMIAVALCWAQAGLAETDVAQALKAAFPEFKYDSISPSPVKGLYEVVSGQRVGYFAPEEGIFIVGSMIDKSGKNLTAERMNELIAQNVKGLPLDKAVKIGGGKHVIIEITDPDCPYCRRASDFFSKRTDVTRHIFFSPLASHPQANDKVLYIFCAADKAKAYEDAMTGKLDDMAFKPCEDPQARDLLKTHVELADRLGIKGTPFFFVDGQTAVFGADIPQLEKLLGN